MKLALATSCLASLSCLASAVPSTKDVVASPFLLKTVAVNGTKYDGMYVIPAHTFAGGNSAGVFEGSRNAVPSYLENTALYFKFGKKSFEQYPLNIYYTDYASAWYGCTINIESKPLKGFFLNKDNYLVTKGTGLKESDHKGSNGAYWRVCKWAHGYPELFLNNAGASNNPNVGLVPSNCALVNLKAVPT